MSIPFSKYHGLGNDYIVLNPSQFEIVLSKSTIQRICHRNFGIGSDGILVGPSESETYDFVLRIYNPDGSEAEKSGNGLRIFSRYLWDKKLIKTAPFTIMTLGGAVTSQVFDGGKRISVDMGTVSFNSRKIPVDGSPREVLNETIVIENEEHRFCAATIGNPHCVILKDDVSSEETRKIGPSIEIDSRFPNRTNVQFMKIIDRANIQIEIWERGAGYTLASGSSASAAAAVACKLELCDSPMAVHMPGGKIDIAISDDFSVQMTGAVTKVCEGFIDEELFSYV